MPTKNLLHSLTCASFLLLGLVGSALGQEASCPDPVMACLYFHNGTAEASSWCKFAECFDKTELEAGTVVASDDEGLFPRTFKSWHHDGEIYYQWSAEPCEIEEKAKGKTKYTLPEGAIRCGAGLITSDRTYYWHFVSNPATGCLGVLECKETL